MKKRFLGVLLLVVMMISMTLSSSLAYSDDLFEFDMPDSYANMSYQNMYIFSDSNNSDRGLIIYSRENSAIKKSVWDIEDSDLDKLVNTLASKASVVSKKKRAKLGKEKAVEVVLSEDGNYIDLYVLASNKYIYMVTFLGTSEADLDNTDYTMIKKSFKLKDHTTNFKMIYFIIIIAVGGISMYIKYRKRHY